MIVYFNNVPHTDLDLLLLGGYVVPLAVNTRVRSNYVPNRAGSIYYGSDLAEREFKFPFAIITSTEQGIENIGKRFLDMLVDSEGKPKEIKLRTSIRPEIEYIVRYADGIDLDRLYGIGRFEIKLVADDPYGYLLTMNNITNFNNVTLNNANLETHCRLELRAHATLSFLEVFLDGVRKIRVNYNFVNGNTVVIDTKARTLTINGVDGRKYMTIDSDYFMIPKGNFKINTNFTCSGGVCALQYKGRCI